MLDRARSRVLLRRADRRWDFPTLAGPEPWFETGRLADALAELGLSVFVQRCLLGDENEVPNPDRLYVGCSRTDPVDGPAGTWFGLTEMPELTGGAAAAWSVVRGWLAGDPDARDWERPGWLEEVEAFVAAHLGTPVRMRELRTWSRSSVWRVAGDRGTGVVKASPGVYGDEGRIAGALAELFGERFPAVFAIDGTHGWVLMEDVGGRPLTDCEPTWWHQALRTLAEVQLEARKQLGALRAAGCPDLGPATMRDWTGRLLGPDGPVRRGDLPGLDPSAAAALLGRAGRLLAAWDELASAGIPDTYEHGDFRPNNVVVDRGAVRFLDVADGAVAHPFFSAVTMLDFEPLPAVPGIGDALRESYLRPWRDAYPETDVDAAYQAARPLAVLGAALVRQYRWLPAMVPRRNWEFMTAYWLRKLPDPAEETR